MPPADPPRASRPKRRRPKPPSARDVQRATQQALPLSPRPVRPKPVRQARRAQRQTEHAQPLSPTPVRPTPVSAPRRVQAKPLAAAPPRNIRAGKPVTTKRQERSVAVAAYDQLPSGAAKRAHVRAAQKRIGAGKGTTADKAIVHTHSTRVEGNKKRASAIAAYNALAGEQVGGTGKGLHFEPGTTVRDGRVISPKGKDIGKVTKSTAERSGTVATVPSLRSIGKAITAVGAASSKGYASIHAPKIIQNAPKDIADLAVTTPSAIAKLGSDIVHRPEKVPGELVAPYKELAKDPKKFITERPVSAALMLTGPARGVTRAAGRGVRLTGKQTLARPSATLPGTTLKEARTGSRGAVTRAVQARKDRAGPPTMTAAHVQRRVDEFYDFQKHHVQRATASAAQRAQTKAKGEGKTKAQVRDIVQEQAEGARAGAKAHEVKRKFAQEFGAPHIADANGRVVRPKDVEIGALHNSRETAQTVADHLNAKDVKIKRGAHGLHQAARRNVKTPLEFAVRDAGYGQFAAVPKVAKDRIETHGTIGKSKALGAREMRIAGRSFRNAVLPLSARWLVGQVGEAGFRAAVARAGPADVLRLNKIVKKMNATQKGSGDEFLMRVTGGQFGMTGTAREFAHGRSLAEEFKDSAWEDPAHFATKAATSKPAMAVRKGWQRYTNVVFNTVNGFFEQTARKAMAGQAIRQGPLMEKRLAGMTEKALADAAKGLKGTDAQVQVARDVDRMYGKYQKFSPDLRERLLHSTPFYPWYRNMVTFLTQTLPVDHPLQAALVADLDAATEEWRKAHGLSFHAANRKPPFLQGGYPTASGGVKRVGRYLPFSPADPVEAGADLFLPQYGNIKAYLTGTDWKGDPVKGSRIKAAAGSVAQAHVPSAGQATRITKKIREGKTLKQALLDEIAPLPTTKGGTPRKRGGSGIEAPSLELTPLQLQQLELGG